MRLIPRRAPWRQSTGQRRALQVRHASGRRGPSVGDEAVEHGVVQDVVVRVVGGLRLTELDTTTMNSCQDHRLPQARVGVIERQIADRPAREQFVLPDHLIVVEQVRDAGKPYVTARSWNRSWKYRNQPRSTSAGARAAISQSSTAVGVVP